MNKISILIHTASKDNFLLKHGILSAFQMYIDNLEKQDFKDFELVYTDRYYEENKKRFSKIKSSFLVKHVPLHKTRRYWADNKKAHISSAKNNGILYADGELLITFDDSQLFPKYLLSMYWDYYQKGLLLNPYFKRLSHINSKNGKFVSYDKKNVYVNDSRFISEKPNFKYKEFFIHRDGSRAYTGTCFSLEDALAIGGFNEKFCGCKSLEDVDFGIRLSMYGKTFVSDKNAYMYIIDHAAGNYLDEDLQYIVVKENYGFIMICKQLGKYIANIAPLTDQEIEIIRQQTLKYQHFNLDLNDPDTKFWLNTPNFDLRQQRKELRESNDWLW